MNRNDILECLRKWKKEELITFNEDRLLKSGLLDDLEKLNINNPLHLMCIVNDRVIMRKGESNNENFN